MAIENLGLTMAASYAAALAKTGGSSNKVYDPGTTVEPYVRFRTGSGKNGSKKVHVTVEWQGVKRATAADKTTAYGSSWASSSAAWDVPDAGLSSGTVRLAESGGYFEWAFKLTSVVTLANLTTTDWKFASRKFDELHFRISVYTDYADGVSGPDGETSSPTATADAWIGYIPTVSLSEVSYDLNNLTISITRSATWLRGDDRWALEKLTIGGSEAVNKAMNLWGQYGNGTITVPVKSLKVKPSASAVTGSLRINSNFKSIGYNLTTVAISGTVADHSTCNTPTLSTSVDGSTVTVNVTDSGNRGVAITKAVVSLKGSAYDFDTKTVSVPGSATFRLCPVGTSTFTAVGTDNLDGTNVSRQATKNATVKSDQAVTVTDVDSWETVAFDGDPSWSWSGGTDQVSAKLAGRERESTWHGVGGSVTGTLSGVILGSDAISKATTLMDAKRVLVRLPDGYRKMCSVEKAAYTALPYGATVSISLREVV